jgi:PAS domain S-box-containing protein
MVFLLMTIIFGVLFYVQGIIHDKSISAELSDRAATVAAVLASSVQKAFVENKFDELNHSVENVGNQKEIALIGVFDNVGTLISIYQDTLLLPYNYREILFEKQDIIDLQLDNLKLNSLKIPITDDGHLWGNIFLIFDQTSIRNQLDVYRIYSFILFGIGIIAVIIATWFLTRYISKPLEELQTGAIKISEGDFAYKLSVNRSDEIGQLATAFNKMSQSISEMINELSNKNKELSYATSRLRWLSQIASQIGEGVIVTDLGGLITFVNNAWLLIHGYSINDFVGKHISLFFTRDQFEKQLIPLLEKVIEEEQFSSEIGHVKSDGTIFPTESTATLLKNKNGDKIGIIQIAIDITQIKENEKQLIEQREKAEEASRLKSSFLANMSHELRTPMFGILGYSEILKELEKNADKKVMIETISQSGTRLLETLNLILDLSKIEADKIEIKFVDVDIVKTINETILLFSKAAGNKNLQLNCEKSVDSLILKIDERLLREALNNLVNNAIKYTQEGSVKVLLDVENQSSGKFAVIKVVDTGIGIDEKNKSLIFEEFRQVSEGFNRSFEGAGLGLSITKKFIEKMNGQIFVESELNVGSTFVLRFPLKEEAIRKVFKQTPVTEKDSIIITPPTEAQPSILVVENDEINQNIITLYLKNRYTVDIVSTGEQAIDAIENKQYSALLMDINLGRGMNGLEATQIIRKNSNYKEIPIIAVTAFAMSGDRLEFLSKGCSHYIAKPFGKEEILQLLQKVVKLNN